MSLRRLQPPPELVTWFRGRCARWFKSHGRRFPWRESPQSAYRLVIAEVMLQRTTANAAAAFVPSFLAKYPSWNSLDSASLDELELALRPVGLWRRRAQALKALAAVMAGTGGKFPLQREALESLPGIGQYIANAVVLLVHRRPAPLLDSNMARVLERFFEPRQLVDLRYDPYLQELAATVVDCQESRQLNWAILDIAASICRARAPLCPDCPLRERCRYANIVSSDSPTQGRIAVERS